MGLYELVRERITTEEANLYNYESHDRYLLDFWEDPKIGDLFVVRGTSQPRILVDLPPVEDENYMVYEDNGEHIKVKFDDCIPLFSAVQLLDILSFQYHVSLITKRGGWLLSVDGFIFQCDDKDICGLLWKAILKVFSKKGF